METKRTTKKNDSSCGATERALELDRTIEKLKATYPASAGVAEGEGEEEEEEQAMEEKDEHHCCSQFVKEASP